MENKILRFDVENADIVYESPDSQFATAKIQAFSTGASLHDTTCDEETLKRTAPTIYEKPIIFELDNRLRDFGGHGDRPIISGFVVPNSAEFNTLPDGRTSLTIFAKIWKKYAPKFLQVFKETGTKNKSVSVEMDVKEYEETQDGMMRLLDFVYSAICVLGDFVTPASPNANIQMLTFAEKENLEYKKIYEAEFSSGYDSVDFVIPDVVKNNAKEALEKHKNPSYMGKGTSVSLAVGRHLVNNVKVSPEKVREIYNYFLKNPNDDFVIGLHGGKEAARWCKDIVEKMDLIDSKKVTFFESIENKDFIYKSLKDINPSLKGIDPPITLGQANSIAKQADAIGSDDKKNGWAIAISSFKKTHKVENGHWVKKENMTEDEEEFSKENLGKGDALKVDKSKDAMSEKSWGEVDKTNLRNKVLDASNYESLVKDVYMLVENGWEDSPSQHLKYPVMELKGDTLVYNRYGLSSALQRAKGQNESEVVSKVEEIYGKLGLDKPDNENMSIEDNYLGMEDSAIMTKEKEKVMATEEEEKVMAEEETPAEEKKETPEEEKKEEEMAEETPAEDKKETPEEEKKEEDMGMMPEDEMNMSLNENLDVAALLGFLKAETKAYRDIKDEQLFKDVTYSINLCMGEIAKGRGANAKVVSNAMLEFMKLASSRLRTYFESGRELTKENKELKEFKTSVEAEKKSYQVDSVLREAVEAGMPDEEVENCRAEAENYSLEDIDSFKNMVKAKAFTYFGKKKLPADDTIKIGLPFQEPRYKSPSIWD